FDHPPARVEIILHDNGTDVLDRAGHTHETHRCRIGFTLWFSVHFSRDLGACVSRLAEGAHQRLPFGFNLLGVQRLTHRELPLWQSGGDRVDAHPFDAAHDGLTALFDNDSHYQRASRLIEVGARIDDLRVFKAVAAVQVPQSFQVRVEHVIEEYPRAPGN